nr:type I-B CRISPR-associated endonuclease Cas1b [Thermoflavimicrobium dichotomicum]
MTQPISLVKSEGTLAIQTEQEQKRFPIEQIESIYVLASITCTTKLLELASRYGIPIHFFHYYGFYIGSFFPDQTPPEQSEIVVEQVLSYCNAQKRLFLAKEFVLGAQTNMLRNITQLTNKITNKLDLSQIQEKKKELNLLRSKLSTICNLSQLLGCEGRFRLTYYQILDEFMKRDFPEFLIQKRTRRPPKNPMNSLLSYLNSLLYVTIIEQLRQTPLHPTISYLHSTKVKRLSLALDISEIFKPVIVDRLILRMITLRMLDHTCFEERDKGCFLTTIGKQKVIKEYQRKLNSTFFHRQKNKIFSYLQLIRHECTKLVQHFSQQKSYQSFRIWW